MSNELAIRNVASLSPQWWWRRLCEVTPNLVVSGDLHSNRTNAKKQLDQWVGAGITCVIDCRGEWSDKEFVATHAPHIVYHDHGTHDNGSEQDRNWFEDGWSLYLNELGRNPEGKVLAHCHMGVNRAPSLAFYLLLRSQYRPKRALEMIREARPIAACHYARDAWRAFVGARSDSSVETGIKEIDKFFEKHGMDASKAIHAIRLAEYEDEDEI